MAGKRAGAGKHKGSAGRGEQLARLLVGANTVDFVLAVRKDRNERQKRSQADEPQWVLSGSDWPAPLPGSVPNEKTAEDLSSRRFRQAAANVGVSYTRQPTHPAPGTPRSEDDA